MKIFFYFEEDKILAKKILERSNFEEGKFVLRQFPDQESYLQITSDVKDKEIILLCSLNHPNKKALDLMFFAQNIKDLGGKNITLIAPYLSYMRQDKRFKDGEAITSRIFAKFLSQHFDHLITIDPHLHRYQYLEEIYNIKCSTIHSNDLIADYIKNNFHKPLLIGPDSESKQWVKSIANKSQSDFVILEKIRYGDYDVDINSSELEKYQDHQVIIIDDIISSGSTAVKIVKDLKKFNFKDIIYIAIHGLFAKNSYQELQNLGIDILTCNTINHISNKIDVSELIYQKIIDTCL